MKRIQSKANQLVTFKVNKISSSHFDNKLHIPNNGFKTIAYEHIFKRLC